jgi:hypothetical protein
MGFRPLVIIRGKGIGGRAERIGFCVAVPGQGTGWSWMESRAGNGAGGVENGR